MSNKWPTADPAYHAPWQLVEEIGMLDHLTGGRLEIGTAAGIPNEMAKVGLGHDEARARNDEVLESLDLALKSPVISYHGKFWHIPCIFPAYQGIWAETGSHMTASTATQSPSNRPILYSVENVSTDRCLVRRQTSSLQSLRGGFALEPRHRAVFSPGVDCKVRSRRCL